MKLLKPILISFGTMSLGLAIIGIVVPGIPATPFFLLSAGLYLRSSEKLHNKLLSNKWVGPYIIKYQKNKGLSKRGKIIAMMTMWFMILLSCLVFITSLPLKTGVLIVGLIGTWVMVFLVPTIRNSNDENQ